jgi:hypothetical protein
MQDLYTGFKKVSEDDKMAVLEHENGHKLNIAKSGLNKKQISMLKKLPLYQAKGTNPVVDSAPDAGDELKQVGREISSAVAENILQGATEAVSRPEPQLTPEQIAKMPDPTATSVETGEPVAAAAGRKGPEGYLQDYLAQKTEPGIETNQLPPTILGAVSKQISEPGKYTIEGAKKAIAEEKATQRAISEQAQMPREAMAPGEKGPGILGATTPTAALAEEPQKQLAGTEAGLAAKPTQPAAAQAPIYPSAVETSAALQKDPMSVLADPRASDSQKADAFLQASVRKHQQIQAADEEFYREMKDPKNDIKPVDMFTNKDVFGAIGTIAGLLISGVGAGLAGTESMAMKYLDKQIEREIDAQKRSQEKKFNLHKMHMQQLGDSAAADLQVATNIRQVALMKMEEKMGLIGNNPMAQLRLKEAMSGLVAKIQEDEFKMTQYLVQADQRKLQRQALLGQTTKEGKPAGGLNPQDPSVLVSLAPEGRQKDITQEIKHRKEINKIAPELLNLFDQIDSYSYTPGATAAFQGLLTTLVPLIEGQASIAGFQAAEKKYTPSKFNPLKPGANKAIRKSLQTWLSSKSDDSAFRSSTMGRSLDEYQSTAHPWAHEKRAGDVGVEERRDPKTGQIFLYDSTTKQPIGIKQ